MSQPVSSLPISRISDIYPVLARYQQHVHHLEYGVETERLLEKESALQSGIPTDLKQFLSAHNGAILFDGDLCIRSLSALSMADANHPEVVCFAQMNVQANPLDIDGIETEHWAYIIDTHGEGCYGLWTGQRFVPLYRSFEDWLMSNIQLLMDGTFPSLWIKRRMLSNTPVFFDAMNLEDLIANGAFEKAISILGSFLQELPNPKSWMQYAYCLQQVERSGWESALFESVRSLHFPISHADILPTQQGWLAQIIRSAPILRGSIEEFLMHFWHEEVSNIQGMLSVHDLRCIEEIAMLLCTNTDQYSLKYLEVVEQFTKWNPQYIPASLMLSQIDQAIQQEQHDGAEAILFQLMRRSPKHEALCLLRLARIVVRRHEPWGLHILFDLLDLKPALDLQAEAWLLAAEYCLDNEQFDQVTEFLARVPTVYDVEFPHEISSTYWLLRGILAHHQQRLGDAGHCLKNAIRLAPSFSPRCLGRAYSAEASLYQTMKSLDRANSRYNDAMQVFSSMGASLSMAETLLDWGRMTDNRAYFQHAYSLFQQIGFASGMAVVDRHLDGRNSWAWYLDATKDLVQRWVQLQRAQGRGVRSEVDNPERRLYGLQMAISETSVEVVEYLRMQISAARMVIERDQVTTSHEQYAYFVAGIELLLSHRSVQAQDAILEFVRGATMDSIAYDALVHSLSRTRNLIVIDSLRALLRSDENLVAQCIAVSVLGERRIQEALPAILHLLEETAEIVLQKVCLLALGRLGDHRLIPTLDAYADIPELVEDWAIALLLLGDEIAVHQLASQLAAGRLGELGVLGHLVGRFGGVSHLLLLQNLAASEENVSISAIHGLGFLGDVRALPMLVEMTGLRDRNKAIAASHALEILTGHHENTEEYMLRARWQAWLEEHGRFEENVRYRYGHAFSPEQLIAGLEHDDRLVRSAAYDELVIMTGIRLPFDVDASWRLQKAQIQSWKRWWQEQRTKYPIGKWVLHGEVYR